VLLAIDPGGDTGWALFDSGRLIHCGVSSGKRSNLPDVPPDASVYLEVPEHRPHREKNPQAILTLAVRTGEMGGGFRAKGHKVTYVTPNEWKGGPVPKPVQHIRDKARLDAAETGLLTRVLVNVAEGKRHNLLDAIGIGLFALGRGYRKMVGT
jgi:hypothetical protein